MTLPELTAAFETLPPPNMDGSNCPMFSAVQIADASPHRLAKDRDGRPCAMLAANPNSDCARVPIVLHNLAVTFNLQCVISTGPRNNHEGIFTVITCTSDDPDVRSQFLSFVLLIVDAIRGSTDESRIRNIVNDLIELFRAAALPPRKQIQGLWGELLIIAQAAEPATILDAWHAEPTDAYDFNSGSERVEVKTSSRSPRAHCFSLEQLTSPPQTRTVIASILVRRSGAGLSVFDLIQNAAEKSNFDADRLLQVNLKVHQILGSSWHSAREIRFDMETAIASIRYHDSAEVPRIPTPIPPAISQVSFVVEMEGVPCLSAAVIQQGGELVRNLPISAPTRP